MDGIVLKNLTPNLLEDYLHFFDNDAFADNPHWSACYCRCHNFNHEECDFDNTSAEVNRKEVINLIKDDIINGYLAYENNKPIGWLNANNRKIFTAVPYSKTDSIEKVGSVMCFVIAKDYRRKGVARRLLDAAIENFTLQELDYAEAYPVADVVGDDNNYHGPQSLYISAGFKEHDKEIRGDVEVIIMRKKL